MKKFPVNLFLDLQKAFDSIPHHLILRKLRLFGFDTKIIMLISDCLSYRYQSGRINETILSPFKAT